MLADICQAPIFKKSCSQRLEPKQAEIWTFQTAPMLDHFRHIDGHLANVLKGGDNAAKIVQQVAHLYSTAYQNHDAMTPFYQFMQPCKNMDYRTGESWLEWAVKIGVGETIDQFRYCLKKVATKVRISGKPHETELDRQRQHHREEIDTIFNDKLPIFDDNGKMLNAHHLIIYATDRGGKTWFAMNVHLYSNVLLYLHKPADYAELYEQGDTPC